MAANYSSQYKVPKVYMYQHVPESIFLNVTQVGCNPETDSECFHKHMTLFQHGLANLGSKKTITVSNHFGNMDFVLYSSKGNLISGKAKLLSDTKEKMSKATDKKVAFVFKYD